MDANETLTTLCFIAISIIDTPSTKKKCWIKIEKTIANDNF